MNTEDFRTAFESWYDTGAFLALYFTISTATAVYSKYFWLSFAIKLSVRMFYAIFIIPEVGEEDTKCFGNLVPQRIYVFS